MGSLEKTQTKNSRKLPFNLALCFKIVKKLTFFFAFDNRRAWQHKGTVL